MRNSNDIKNLLHIQDTNITFSTNCVEMKVFKGRLCKFITAKLSYTPDNCAICSMKNERFSIIKNGSQTSHKTQLVQISRLFYSVE